ncbi:hypothetical protein [Mycolicibacterium sp.]|uniref:hypothetical protein n=1 Tax=Mycolicibacterium sp. TaxID=2320850 RepID=UPI0037C62F5D
MFSLIDVEFGAGQRDFEAIAAQHTATLSCAVSRTTWTRVNQAAVKHLQISAHAHHLPL